MFRHIKWFALAAATIGMLFVGSTAMAAPGWRGGGIGIGVGAGRGYGGYGYRGGYVGGGYGRYYGGYRGGYPGGYYGRYGYGYPGYSRGLGYGVGLGTAGYYGGYGYGYPYSSYGYSYPSYGNSFYSTPTIYASPTVYAAPASRVVVAKPIVPDVVTSAGTIKLRLPANADGSVNYQLNGTAFTMDPGFSQKFDNDRTWTITFDDGTGRMESQALPTGNYVFARNASGLWELRTY